MHIWIIERKEMYTNDEFFPILDCNHRTRELARDVIKYIKILRNLNSKGPHYTYRIKKYVREE
jgi:hypothetical protein